MSILLLPAPQLGANGVGAYVSYGVCSLQACCGGLGVEIDILQYWPLFGAGARLASSEAFADAVASSIDPGRYDVVGLSTMGSSFHHSLNIARLLKERRADIRLWMGGPHASASPLKLLEAYPWIEAVFVGEAETSFRAAVSRLADGDAHLEGIPGVQVRGEEFSRAALIEDLDTLPFVDDSPGYRAAVELQATATGLERIYMEGERGCPGHCSFCSTSRFWGSRTRRKSVARLLEEMDRLKTSTRLRYFSLLGDNFGYPREELLRFCTALVERSARHEWCFSLKLDQLDVEDMDLLWHAGCRGIFVGLESASQQTLDRLGKEACLAKELELVYAAIDRGIAVDASLIVGFPWEKSRDVRETLRLHRLLLEGGVNHSQVYALCLHPGTPMERVYRSKAIPWEGLSLSALDHVPWGTETQELMERCPDLFTQFSHVPSGASMVEISSALMTATMLDCHHRERRAQANAPVCRPASS